MVSIELESDLLKDRWGVAGIICPLKRVDCLAGWKMSSALGALEGE